MASLSSTVVVFDLDDTLYPEEDYVQSGISFVCRTVTELYEIDTFAQAQSIWGHRGDWISAICAEVPAATELKTSLLWAYRTHAPKIRLRPNIRDLLDRVERCALGVAVLTDGRALAQRLKLKALGLSDWPVFISDEYGGQAKPDPTRYKAIMARYGAARYVYVGDNPCKDFKAPLALGWQTIGFEGFVSRRLDGQRDGFLCDDLCMPHAWVDDPAAVLDVLAEL